MDIIVCGWDHSWVLSIASDATVSDLQKRIAKEHRLPVHEQCLSFENHPLSHGARLLTEYGVDHESTIQLQLRLCGGSSYNGVVRKGIDSKQSAAGRKPPPSVALYLFGTERACELLSSMPTEKRLQVQQSWNVSDETLARVQEEQEARKRRILAQAQAEAALQSQAHDSGSGCTGNGSEPIEPILVGEPVELNDGDLGVQSGQRTLPSAGGTCMQQPIYVVPSLQPPPPSQQPPSQHSQGQPPNTMTNSFSSVMVDPTATSHKRAHPDAAAPDLLGEKRGKTVAGSTPSASGSVSA